MPSQCNSACASPIHSTSLALISSEVECMGLGLRLGMIVLEPFKTEYLERLKT